MNLDTLLSEILKPSLGCTEPVSVALAVSIAKQSLNHRLPTWLKKSEETYNNRDKTFSPISIAIHVNKNVFKNAFSIYLPNTDGEQGIIMAAALGLFTDPEHKMTLFESLTPEIVKKAQNISKEIYIDVSVSDDNSNLLLIEVTLEVEDSNKKKHTACTKIFGSHDNVVFVQADNEILFEKNISETSSVFSNNMVELSKMPIEEIVNLVENLSEKNKILISNTIEKNIKACLQGLNKPHGLGSGYQILNLMEVEKNYTDRLISSGYLPAAGSDARMSGHAVEVMSSSGSGNQGIAATMPIISYAHRNQLDKERLIKSVALSHLITAYITVYLGYLSPMCGAILKAGVGAAAGIMYYKGGSKKNIEQVINLMIGYLAGIMCDGAKPGCALRVALAGEIAATSAYMVSKGVEISDDNGIIGSTAEETIQNLAELAQAMKEVDSQIITIMKRKMKR